MKLTKLTGEALHLDASSIQEVVIVSSCKHWTDSKGLSRPTAQVVHTDGIDTVKEGFWKIWKGVAREKALQF